MDDDNVVDLFPEEEPQTAEDMVNQFLDKLLKGEVNTAMILWENADESLGVAAFPDETGDMLYPMQIAQECLRSYIVDLRQGDESDETPNEYH